MHGHSPAVAELAASASAEEERATLRLAGLLHDLGRVSVPNGIWDRPDALTTAQWERVRLHPHYTERILARTAAFSDLAPLAACCHERLDGGGYHRGLPDAALTAQMRTLAAADAYRAMTAERAHRPARSRDDAAAQLRADAAAGRLCRDAVEAVLEAAGHPPAPPPPRPADLTERGRGTRSPRPRPHQQADRPAARGLAANGPAPRRARVLEDRPARAGRAAMFAMEHRLVGPGE
jgi:HD-GYP domain-containing protein (c-di-GMP phosphodiesterase class II)